MFAKEIKDRLRDGKKLAMYLSAVFVLVFSVEALAGEPARNLDPGIAPPHSHAFGKSLDEWTELYFRWFENGQDPESRVGKVAFLPIAPGPLFEVSVKPGTPLVLPVVAWLAFGEDDFLPNEWFGDPNHIFGNVYLDGVAIAEPNADYYVGPTELDPPLFGVATHFQAIVFVTTPLTPGEHQIVLHSEFVDFGVAFDNIWNITVER
jgi:hypothetical protein